jgi:hypothetical protein
MEAIPKGHDPALHANIDKPDDADPFSPGLVGVVRLVEYPVEPEVGGVAGLEGPNARDESGGAATEHPHSRLD